MNLQTTYKDNFLNLFFSARSAHPKEELSVAHVQAVLECAVSVSIYISEFIDGVAW